MDGFRVRKVEQAIPRADIVVTATGNRVIKKVSSALLTRDISVYFSLLQRVITRDHMERQMKPGCVVCNMGHANTEVDVASLKTPDVTWERLRPNLDHVMFKDGKRICLLAEGRLLTMAATSPSSLTVNDII